MNKEARVFIEHILESIRLVQTYTSQLSKDDFLALGLREETNRKVLRENAIRVFKL